MKTQISIKLFVIITLMLCVSSCKKMNTCQKMENSDLTMLIDISDKQLFNEIKEDIFNNLPVFMKESKLGMVGECQTFRMSIGNLSGQDVLDLQSAKIGIEKKGLSGNEKKRRSNPLIIKNLINKTLSQYDDKSKDLKFTSSTNILQTVVKSIIGMEENSDNTLVIFTDLVENNKSSNVNFYRSIPKEDEIDITIEKLIDPILLSDLKNKLDEGHEVKVIIVQKAEPNGKVNKRDLKIFWEKCFNSLDIDNIKFIDNLTNKIR